MALVPSPLWHILTRNITSLFVQLALFSAQKEQALYIFAGQRQKDYLSDFYRYDIEKDELIELCRDSSNIVRELEDNQASLSLASLSFPILFRGWSLFLTE
jgi:hypothetical protein